MANILATVDRPVAIRQSLIAGNNWTGVKPANGGLLLDPSFEYNTWKFAPATAAGLFNPMESYYSFDTREALDVVGVEIALSDQTAWSIEKVDADGSALVVFSGATESSIVITSDTDLLVFWGEYLRLNTTAATGAMEATIKFQPHGMQVWGD